MRRLIVGIGLVLALLILFVPAYLLRLTWQPPEPVAALITPNTKNSSRFLASTPAELSEQVATALFPVGSDSTPGGVIRVAAENWQAGVIAAPLIRWVNGPLVMDESATGVTVEGGESFAATDLATLAADVDDAISTRTGTLNPSLLLVPEDPGYAIPAAYLAAQYGTPILFASDALSPATREVLERRGGDARLYTLGIDGDALGLDEFGTFKELNAGSDVTVAIEMAEYYDEANNFGWGFDTNEFGWRVDANYNFVLANRELPEMAIAGVSLGRFGKFGPLLWVDQDRIPVLTNQLLVKSKPEWYVNPVEGPFNHLWFLGDPSIISTAVQGRADLTQEIGPYRFQEDYALSGFEMLFVIWIVAGIVSAIWLVLYSWRRIPQISAMMLVTWGLLGLVMGPIAVWIYNLSYNQTPWRKAGMACNWERRGTYSTLAASAMNRGFDGPLMLVISWVVTWIGLPMIVFQGPLFWLGSSMMFGIFFAYFGALLLHWLVMHSAMFMMREGMSYKAAVKRAFFPAFASMTAMAIGMMGFMWWIMMVNLGQMPDDDEFLWWGTTVFSVVVGWLVALPIDAWLVRRKIQPGSM